MNDTELDYSKHINDKLSETITKNIQGKLFDISLIVWNRKINEKFCCYYFDANNCIKGKDTTTFNRNTVDFYHSVFISSTFIEENIVVELKAPRVPLSKIVSRQIEDYMDYIRTKPQFNSQQRRWKFIAVCKEVDDNIKALYNTFKDFGKPGLIHKNDNYEIYALTWDDIFTSFELRHTFMLEKLNFDKAQLIEELKKDSYKPSRETVNKLTEIATQT